MRSAFSLFVLVSAVVCYSIFFNVNCCCGQNQDDGQMTVVSAGVNLYLKEGGLIKGKLFPSSGYLVTMTEPIDPLITIQLLGDCLAVVTREKSVTKVRFFSRNAPFKELTANSVPLAGSKVFCLARGNQIFLSDAKTVCLLLSDGSLKKSFRLLPSNRSRGACCAYNGQSAVFGFHNGEWGSRIISVDCENQKERIIWTSQLQDFRCLIEGGNDRFYAIVGCDYVFNAPEKRAYTSGARKIISWKDSGPVETTPLSQEIKALCPFDKDKVLVLLANGDIYATKLEKLSGPLDIAERIISRSSLFSLLFCNGIIAIGEGRVDALVCVDLKTGSESAIKLGDHQINSVFDGF